MPSVWFRSWFQLLAVSSQVMWVINPAVGCHYFLPGQQLPFWPIGRYQFRCLVNRGTTGVNSLPKTVIQQRHGCNLNPGPTVPESSMLTTRLPSHPSKQYVVPYWHEFKLLNGKCLWCIFAWVLWLRWLVIERTYSPSLPSDLDTLHVYGSRRGYYNQSLKIKFTDHGVKSPKTPKLLQDFLLL